MIINTGLEVILAAFIAAFIAQLIKTITFSISHNKVNFKTMMTTGGMPSSHSSTVIALSTSVGIITGFKSVEFAIALGYALIVMYDAAGLRRAAGKMAATLNKLVEELYAHRRSEAGDKLRELLGHTPIEVYMGALLGFFVSFSLHYLLMK